MPIKIVVVAGLMLPSEVGPPFSCKRTHSRRFCWYTSSTRMPSAAPMRAKE